MMLLLLKVPYYRHISLASNENKNATRMHSSRMRTGRSLTVCRSLLPGGGWGWGHASQAVCFPGGCVLPRGMHASWMVHVSWGVHASRGCMLPGVCVLPGRCMLPRGVCFPGGGIPACTEADPPVDRITDTSKNITLATTSLRLVKMQTVSSLSVMKKIDCSNVKHR